MTVLGRAAALGRIQLPEGLRVVAEAGPVTRADSLRLAQTARELAQALPLFLERGWLEDEQARSWVQRLLGSA